MEESYGIGLKIMKNMGFRKYEKLKISSISRFRNNKIDENKASISLIQLNYKFLA